MQNDKISKVKKTRPGSTGPNHWNYQHGNETLAAKQKRSKTSLRLHYLQDIGHQLSFMGGRHTVGRKPVNYINFNMNDKNQLIRVIELINKIE